MIDGVPISEADITATNGVIHRLSSAVMAPPDTVAGVLLDPPFPLSAAAAAGETMTGRGGAGVGGRGRGGHGDGDGEEGSGFEALGELVRLAWPLVNATLTEEGPLTVLAPTDAVSLAVVVACGCSLLVMIVVMMLLLVDGGCGSGDGGGGGGGGATLEAFPTVV